MEGEEDYLVNAGVMEYDPVNAGVVEEKDDNTHKELKSILGEYWNNSTITIEGEQYVLAAQEVYRTSYALICDIDPKYEENVLTNKRTRKRKSYAKFTKAVYGTLLRAVLFYQKSAHSLMNGDLIQMIVIDIPSTR